MCLGWKGSLTGGLLLMSVSAGCSLAEGGTSAPDPRPSSFTGSSGTPSPVQGPGVATTAGGVRVVVSGPVAGSSDMAVPGEIAVVSNCLGLRIGDSEHVVIWPSGSSVSVGGEDAVTLPGGRTLHIGDRIVASGGLYEGRLPSSSPSLPDDCPDPTSVILLGEVAD